MKFEYKPYTETYNDLLNGFIHSLYAEDQECENPSNEKIEQTLAFMQLHPEMINIFMFFANNQPSGYSILCNYWSNEYGGMVVLIDELFVLGKFRNQGAGTGFIEFLISSHYRNYVAIILEVTGHNDNALRLYERIGFRITGRRHMIYQLNNALP